MVSHLIKFTQKPKLLDKKLESIPPLPFLDPIYGDDKYSLYRDWWAIQRPTPREQIMLPKAKQFFFILHPSDYDSDFLDLLNHLPKPIRRNLGRIHHVSNLHKLIQYLENGDLLAASDASVTDDGFASHSYTIVSKDENIEYMGQLLSTATRTTSRAHGPKNVGY